MTEFEPQDPVVSQQVQSAVDSIIGCESNDTSNYMLEEGDKVWNKYFGYSFFSSLIITNGRFNAGNFLIYRLSMMPSVCQLIAPDTQD